MKYGCKETTNYNKKHEHELMCIHQPCSCPHRGCDFVASSKLLYLHYSSTHIHSAISFYYDSSFTVPVIEGMKYVVLRERTHRTLFVLNYAVQSIGNVARYCLYFTKLSGERFLIRTCCTQRGQQYQIRVFHGVHAEMVGVYPSRGISSGSIRFS